MMPIYTFKCPSCQRVEEIKQSMKAPAPVCQRCVNASCGIHIPEMKRVYPNSSIKKEIIGEIIGFDRLKNSEACEFVSNITGDNSRSVVSFGTEAGLFQEIGISTVVCGPGSIEQAHKIDEFIELDELKKCLVFLEGVKNKSIN